jgi:hypothetical protein
MIYVMDGDMPGKNQVDDYQSRAPEQIPARRLFFFQISLEGDGK